MVALEGTSSRPPVLEVSSPLQTIIARDRPRVAGPAAGEYQLILLFILELSLRLGLEARPEADNKVFLKLAANLTFRGA